MSTLLRVFSILAVFSLVQNAFADTENYGPYESVISSVRVLSNGKAVFAYSKGGKIYLKVGTQNYGPYENYYAPYEMGQSVEVFRNQSEYSFLFKDVSGYFANVNGKSYWPYDEKPTFQISQNRENYFIRGVKDGKIYTTVNGETFWPSNTYQSVAFSEVFKNRGYGFKYTVGKDMFVVINGKTFWPYVSATVLRVYDSEKYMYSYSKDGKSSYVVVNGKEYWPYESVTNGGFWINAEGFAFSYTLPDEYGGHRFFANVNGKDYGPFWLELNLVFSHSQTQWFILRYLKKNTWFVDDTMCLNINGTEMGCGDHWWHIRNILFSEDGKEYAYVATYSNQYTVRMNGNWIVKGSDNMDGEPVFTRFRNENDYIFTYSKGYNSNATERPFYVYPNTKDRNHYININGKDFWPYESVMDYSYDGTAVKFQYGKDGKQFMNISGKDFWPFDEITSDSSLAPLFVYKLNGTWWIFLNGRKTKAFKDLPYAYLTDRGGGYAISYKNGTKYYATVGRKTFWPYDSHVFVESRGEWFSLVYSKKDGTYVTVTDWKWVERFVSKESPISKASGQDNATQQKGPVLGEVPPNEWVAKAREEFAKIVANIERKTWGNAKLKKEAYKSAILEIDAKIAKEKNESQWYMLNVLKSLLGEELRK